MSIKPAQLFDAYAMARGIVAEEEALAAPFAPVATMFNDKKDTSDAVVMVYGVYNAGKSTLINALLRREAAPVDDIPLTDKVTRYPWGSYTILDTPGVDAPIAHEDVTRAQMLTADVIIFVVDPLGTIEEAQTLEVLVDMVAEGKQIYLVCNEKNNLGEDIFAQIKDELRSRLQALAAERGLSEVLKDMPISKVNARRALQGYLRGQPALVTQSDFPVFEQQLDTFLRSIGPDEVYGRLRGQLVEFLDATVTLFEERSAPGTVRQYEKLLARISSERAQLARDMQREIARQRTHIREAAMVCLRTAPDQCQQDIEALLDQASAQINSTFENGMRLVVALVQAEIDQFDVVVPTVDLAGAGTPAPRFDDAAAPAATSADQAGSPAHPMPGVKDAVQQLGALAKPEHIVSGLKVVKSTLPKLMKGIGIKTMEKWGAAIVGKWIPYVGLAVSAGEGLYHLLKGDPEEERLRLQHAEEQRAQERALMQMDDLVRDLSEGFSIAITGQTAKESANFFDALDADLQALRDSFSEKEQRNAAQLQRVLTARQMAVEA